MDIASLDQLIGKIAEKKNALSNLSYNDEAYDSIEEDLHLLEDEMIEKFGTYLEDAIHYVHDEFCPDTEVLSPLAYLAKKYDSINGGEFGVAPTEGVPVEIDDYPGQETKLVLVPGPTRIVLQIDNDKQEVIWKAS